MSDSYGSGDDRDRGEAGGGAPYGGGYPPYGGGGEPAEHGYPPPQGPGGYPPPQGPGGYPPPPPGGQWPPPAQPGYPAYGGPGYPGGPWDAERPRGWSGLAIAAFLVGLLVPCLGVIVAIPLGIAALVKIRKTREKGKALAWLGIVIPVLWLGLFGAAIAWFVSTEADRDEAGVIVEAGRLDYGDIRVGDCVSIDGLEDRAEIGAFDIEGVPCTDEHNAEVASIVDLTGDEYPGESDVRRQAGVGCAAAQPSLPQGLDIYPLYPTESLWDDDGGKRAICFAVRSDYSGMTGKQLN